MTDQPTNLTFDKLLATVNDFHQKNDRAKLDALRREAKERGVTLGFDGYAVVPAGTFHLSGHDVDNGGMGEASRC